MRTYVEIAAIVLFCTSLVCAQAVTLTGTVIDVKAKFDTEPFLEKQDIEAAFAGMEKAENYVFEVKLYLQFKNESDKSLIIFLPDQFYGETMLTFLGISGSQSEIPLEVTKWKKFYRDLEHDPIPSFIGELAEEQPNRKRFELIEPNGYYECHQTVTVRKGYKLHLKPGQKPSSATPVPEYSRFRLKYFLSLKDSCEDYNPLEKAKTRWKKFGELPVNSNGDYSVTSEVILNKLNN